MSRTENVLISVALVVGCSSASTYPDPASVKGADAESRTRSARNRSEDRGPAEDDVIRIKGAASGVPSSSRDIERNYTEAKLLVARAETAGSRGNPRLAILLLDAAAPKAKLTPDGHESLGPSIVALRSRFDIARARQQATEAEASFRKGEAEFAAEHWEGAWTALIVASEMGYRSRDLLELLSKAYDRYSEELHGEILKNTYLDESLPTCKLLAQVLHRTIVQEMQLFQEGERFRPGATPMPALEGSHRIEAGESFTEGVVSRLAAQCSRSSDWIRTELADLSLQKDAILTTQNVAQIHARLWRAICRELEATGSGDTLRRNHPGLSDREWQEYQEVLKVAAQAYGLDRLEVEKLVLQYRESGRPRDEDELEVLKGMARRRRSR